MSVLDPFNVAAAQVASLDLASTKDEVLTVMNAVEVLRSRMGSLREEMEFKVKEWIDTHGDITCGEIRYYVGRVTTVKCGDVKATTEAVMQAVGGDMEQFAAHLSSSAFKVGACRGSLGDDFGKHFTEESQTDLKTGKPLKKLRTTNDKWSNRE